MSKGQSIPLLSQVRWDTVSALNTFPSLLKIWLLNKIMQTSSLEALQASCSSGPQCLLALQPFHRKLQEARCFPPCHHLLGDAFKPSLVLGPRLSYVAATPASVYVPLLILTYGLGFPA